MIINIKGSLILSIVLLLVFPGASLLIWWLPWPLLLKLLASGALLVVFWGYWQRYILRSRRYSVTALQLQRDGGLAVMLSGASDWQPARRQYQFLHPWLTILVLKTAGKRSTVLLARDALDAEQFTRLRAQLGVLPVSG